MKLSPFILPFLLLASAYAADTAPATTSSSPALTVTFKKKTDTAAVSTSGDTTTITITCSSGIGNATLTRTAKSFGKTIKLRFLYAPDKPFTSLEGCTLAITHKEAAASVLETTNKHPKAGTAEFTLPSEADADSVTSLQLIFVDAYR